jgi:4-hydroxy-tetrahydrodipicolinate synthase
LDAGVDFLVPCGTTGESPTLTRAEHLRVVEIAVEMAKDRAPVLAGAGGYNTREVVELAKELERLGADGILSVTPYYNKPTPEGLYQHYRAIAEAVALPIVLYNVPGRTGVNIEPATLARLATIETVVGVKEASGNIAQMASIATRIPPGFRLLSGDDAVTLPLIALGGCGVISVASNLIPAEITELCTVARRGDLPAAQAIQKRWLPLMEVNFCESNPIPVKWALARLGLIEPVYRLPMCAPLAASQAKIEEVLRASGLLG